MKYRVPLLLLLVCLGASWAAPVDQDGLADASCTDAVVLGAAREAMDKINKDRTEGYVFSLHNVANAHTLRHGENSIMFYLTMNVIETNCSVLSQKNFRECEVRDFSSTPFYGQCKAAIFISRVNRVSRLYKYNCVVRPVAPEKVHRICPDCPSHSDKEDAEVKKTVSLSLDKFNKESGLSKYFSLLSVTRATSGWGMGMIYNVEYTIQETSCANNPDNPENCPPMACEFAHKGFCKGTHVHAPAMLPDATEHVDVKCEIYEPEAAEVEKKLHLLGGETDHSHNDTGVTNPATGHDHAHDHTKSHDQHDSTHQHGPNDQHHHSHDHFHGTHRHGHAHSHEHGVGHDHVHAHHEKAHDHSGDHPHQHHQYTHAAGDSTHHHDHEMALDHEHRHAHLHTHEHHHHHHAHSHHTFHHHPEGVWRQIAALSAAVTLPAFPDTPVAGPEAGVTQQAKQDPQIPGQMEPTVNPFPTKASANCPVPEVTSEVDVGKLFIDDPEFKVVALGS